MPCLSKIWGSRDYRDVYLWSLVRFALTQNYASNPKRKPLTRSSFRFPSHNTSTSLHIVQPRASPYPKRNNISKSSWKILHWGSKKMCIWYRGWYFEDCTCVIWNTFWFCGVHCRVPQRQLLRRFIGICPNCSIMSNLPSNPKTDTQSNTKSKPTQISLNPVNNVPCDSQYDPSDVFDEALEEHMRHHPWNIMFENSRAAAASGGCVDEEEEVWGPGVWGPSLNYNTLLKGYTENQKQSSQQRTLEGSSKVTRQEEQQRQNPKQLKEACQNAGRVGHSQPQPQLPPVLTNPQPTFCVSGGGGYESDNDPVPPEYRYRR